MLVESPPPATRPDPNRDGPVIETAATRAARLAAERAARRHRDTPTWFVAGLTALVVWCAAAGTSGVLLLASGWYHPATVALLATTAALGAGFVAWRRLRPRPHADHAAAIAAVGIALVFFGFAGAYHSEHLLTDRDPAIYINTGRSIAATHQLHPVVRTGAFADRASYSVNAAGFGADSRGRLLPNFFPMLPALLAVGWSFGGDTGLLLVPAALGALGILACYALASRLIGPRAALVAPLVLVVAPFELWFARDAYSELVVQVVALGGLWLYLEARARRSVTTAAIAGAVAASAAFARIDAVAIAIGVVFLLGFDWIRADEEAESVRARRVIGTFGAAFGVVLVFALLVMSYVAYSYVYALRGDYRQLILGTITALAITVGIVVAHRARPGALRHVVRRPALFWAATTIALGVVAWAYWLRPDPESDLPVITSSRIDAVTRRAFNEWQFSRSLHWFTNYVGPAALVLAIAGFAVIGWRALRGNRGATAVFLVVVPIAVLYVARPSISPDQPWAMRRYLPVVIPGLAIAIAVVFGALWAARSRAPRLSGRITLSVVVVALAALVAVPSATATSPFAQASMQRGALPAVHRVCKQVGSDGAVLVYGYAFLNLELPQTLHGFCGVPAATPVHPQQLQLGTLSARWQAFGRRLFVVTAQPDALRQFDPSVQLIDHVVVDDSEEIERVYNHRPERTAPRRADIWVFAVAPTGGTTAGTPAAGR